jgi:hypothetical protein
LTSYKDDNDRPTREFIPFDHSRPVEERVLEDEPENKPEPKALHYSTGKPGVDQIPADVMMELGEVYTYGEQKYARNNWTSGTDWHEFNGSILRHLYRWMNGEEIDPESGCSHLAHVIWNAVTLRYYEKHGLGKDDRLSTVMGKPRPQSGGFMATPEWLNSLFDRAKELHKATDIPFDQCFKDLLIMDEQS